MRYQACRLCLHSSASLCKNCCFDAQQADLLHICSHQSHRQQTHLLSVVCCRQKSTGTGGLPWPSTCAPLSSTCMYVLPTPWTWDQATFGTASTCCVWRCWDSPPPSSTVSTCCGTLSLSSSLRTPRALADPRWVNTFASECHDYMTSNVFCFVSTCFCFSALYLLVPLAWASYLGLTHINT